MPWTRIKMKTILRSLSWNYYDDEDEEQILYNRERKIARGEEEKSNNLTLPGVAIKLQDLQELNGCMSCGARG